MNLKRISLIMLCTLLLITRSLAQTTPVPVSSAQTLPTLDDFWGGRATWMLDITDVGLPIGESDTLAKSDGVYWAYLHASAQSAGVIDQCGAPVAFPGCMTRWESVDGGASFTLPVAVCAMPCGACPCSDERDHVGVDAAGVPSAAQQYPRVAVADDGTHYLAYEWHAQTMLRRSPDGITWGDWAYLTTPGGTWHDDYAPCSAIERIGAHPNIRGEAVNCLVGAPPGIYVDGDTLYVFVAAGSAPGNLRCYKGDRHGDLSRLRICDSDPLFSGAPEYGALDAVGAAANPYFDFRYVSSADVLKVGERYYIAYEGIRGPDVLERGMDTQFGLGLARSVGDTIDGAWEKYPGNPLIMDTAFNWGIGHADWLVQDGITYLYSATSQTTRGRYTLQWR
ncbi:MAG: hypothetical protein H7Y11_06460 [Armatimonadetes bacterium]|nr:hypothetical protein [Anaerolineae bacterium]